MTHAHLMVLISNLE